MKSYLNAAAFSMFLGSEQNDVSWRMDCLKKFLMMCKKSEAQRL